MWLPLVLDTERGQTKDSSRRSGAMVDSTASVGANMAMVLVREEDRCTIPVTLDLVQYLYFFGTSEHAEQELWGELKDSEAFSRHHCLRTMARGAMSRQFKQGVSD